MEFISGLLRQYGVVGSGVVAVGVYLLARRVIRGTRDGTPAAADGRRPVQRREDVQPGSAYDSVCLTCTSVCLKYAILS